MKVAEINQPHIMGSAGYPPLPEPSKEEASNFKKE